MFLFVTKAVPAVLKLVKSFVNYLSGRDFAGTKVYMNYSKKKKKNENSANRSETKEDHIFIRN